MKSLVCSDVHDHIRNFEAALMVAGTSGCDSVIFCGDICSPFMLDVYDRACNLPLHAVFGNNDGDRFHLNHKAGLLNAKRDKNNQIFLHGEFLLAQNGHGLNGIPSQSSIAVYHYPEMAKIIAASGEFEVVCCGHSHRSSIEKMKDCVFINPGSIMGYLPSSADSTVKPSCVIINWSTGELELIEL